MRTKQLVVGTVCVLLAGSLASSPVTAQESEPTTPVVCVIECAQDLPDADGPVVDNSVADFGSPSGGGGESARATSRPPAWLQECTWTFWLEGTDLKDLDLPNDAAQGAIAITNIGDGVDAKRADMGADVWFMTCPFETISNTTAPLFSVVSPTDVPPAIVNALIQEAYDQTPVVSMFPAASPSGAEDIPMITRLSTWLWVDEADWVSVSATSSIPPLSVTTTAAPSKTVWSGGHDPEELTCDRGTPFLIEVAAEAQSTDCEMTWLHSSDVEDFTLDLDVIWDVSYVCSAVCGAGDLPALTTSSTRPIRVAEIQALIN